MCQPIVVTIVTQKRAIRVPKNDESIFHVSMLMSPLLRLIQSYATTCPLLEERERVLEAYSATNLFVKIKDHLVLKTNLDTTLE